MKKNIFTIEKKEAHAINNLYHPAGLYDNESFDEVHIKNCITKENKRFVPILLKEAFGLLKNNGSLTILYNKQRTGIAPDEFEKYFWWLFERGYRIETHEVNKSDGRFIIRKKIATEVKNDDITKWSFGMVTNGVRKDFIKKSIQSIRDQKIPQYEIIVCGNYPFPIEKDIRFIPFTQRDEKGWITRKKNIIAESANYNNLCIFHDRIVFDKDWFKGMKRYGNNFEILSCPQTLESGQRAGDWVSTGAKYLSSGFGYTIQELDYRDWNRRVYIGGQLIILKKNIWEQAPWNETLYWQQAEDIEYSIRLTEKGFIARFNPYATCTTLSWRFGKLPQRQFASYESLRHMLSDVPLRRFTRLSLFYATKIPFVSNIVHPLYRMLEKTNFYTFFKKH